MPGATIVQRGPSARRSNRISCGEATQPSSPTSRARSAAAATCASTLPVTPTSWSPVRSRLVSTVTPRQIGRATPKILGGLRRRLRRRAHHRAAAAGMHVQHGHPMRVASRTRAGDGVRDVVILQIQEQRRSALRAVSTAAGPRP